MEQILLIGDLHSKWASYIDILRDSGIERSIQVGDFGWGMSLDPDPASSAFPKQFQQHLLTEDLDCIGGNHKYFRGNHDNPVLCAQHKHCLPDVYVDDSIGLMSVAGAFSIDRGNRTLGYDWWPEEELSYDQLFAAIDMYEKVKPRVMLSHDCPESVVGHMFSRYNPDFGSRTRSALDNMFSIHQPDLWVFGHWHNSHVYHQQGTKFVCLNELETMVIDT